MRSDHSRSRRCEGVISPILMNGEFSNCAGRGRSSLQMVRGGDARATYLSEREICNTLGPALRERGLLFVAIDVIDGNLTEINVTSPTGIRRHRKTRRPGYSINDLGRDREKAGEGLGFSKRHLGSKPPPTVRKPLDRSSPPVSHSVAALPPPIEEHTRIWRISTDWLSSTKLFGETKARMLPMIALIFGELPPQ